MNLIIEYNSPKSPQTLIDLIKGVIMYCLYKCYSRNLKDFIVKNNIKFENKLINKKTKKVYWTFVISEELIKTLEIWKLNKY